MLPAGKYVVEVVVPSGWELVKEEDKNILVGDVFIAPVTQQFAGIAQHLHPARPGRDQRVLQREQRPESDHDARASINLERSDFNVNTDQVWPCVGEVRTVPDYLSLFPGVEAGGAVRGCRPAAVRSQGSGPGRPDGGQHQVLHLSRRITSPVTSPA